MKDSGKRCLLNNHQWCTSLIKRLHPAFKIQPATKSREPFQINKRQNSYNTSFVHGSFLGFGIQDLTCVDLRYHTWQVSSLSFMASILGPLSPITLRASILGSFIEGIHFWDRFFAHYLKHPFWDYFLPYHLRASVLGPLFRR